MDAKSYHVDEQIVEEPDDWLDGLDGSYRETFLGTVRDLPLENIQRFPPPKLGRVPFGHELRVFGRHVTGGNVLFDPSGLWRVYRGLASARDRQLYRAFILNDPLGDAEWRDVIGTEASRAWIDRRLLRRTDEGWCCRFRICPIGSVRLFGDAERPKLLRRVVIGQDSFNMASFMKRQKLGRFRRYLDVGPGSGVVLLNVAGHADECVGMDINPRAVAISRLNAELNAVAQCTVHDADALKVGDQYGHFDLITWNTPFVFMPEECRNTHLDAFGGHLGLELPLKFMRCLPELLTPNGKSYLGMSAPIMNTGENVLERELDKLAPELGFDIVNHVIQNYWHDLYREFHEAHGITKNELVFLEISRGSGKIRRIEPSLGTRVSDLGRSLVYRIFNQA